MAIDKADQIIYKKRGNFGKWRIRKRKDEVNMRKIYARAAVLLIALSVLFCAACGGNKAEAAVASLVKTQGNVGVSDGRDKEIDIMENLGLYDGYRVGTREESYAWINLDSVKLTKMDEESEIEITKLGRKLRIDVLSGSLFFHITEPLAEDETLDIRTSTMGVGIRGTCGWVEVENENLMCVYLLQGKVECTIYDEDGGVLDSRTITAGQAAMMEKDGKNASIVTTEFDAGLLPDFVAEEIADSDVWELLQGGGESSFGSSGSTGNDGQGAPGDSDPDGTAGENGSDAEAGPIFVPWAEAGLADHAMDWRDAALAAAMAEETGITDRDIMLSDVWELDTLDLTSKEISDVTALAELRNLRYLSLNNNQISDISALGGLMNLDSLSLGHNQISDVSALGGLTNLTILTLGSNQIEDISGLAGLTNLGLLDLGHNQISDISALAGLTNLTDLDLFTNQISDVSALGGLTNLVNLRLGQNQIDDFSPVEFVQGLMKN